METSKHSVALVTGASGGIGLEMAKQLKSRGYRLVLVSSDRAKLAQAADTLSRAAGTGAVDILAVDLAKPGSAQAVAAFTDELGLEVDVLVNNAGFGDYGEHVELNAERLARMLQLNVSTLSELCLVYGQRMKARKSGRILNVASTAAYQPTPYFAAYGASKSFVLNFSEALAKELEDHGVTVSCLSPGPTDTSFFGDLDRSGVKNDHFERGGRDSAAFVAEVGLSALFSGRLSQIVGTGNFWRAFSSRIAPRAFVANFAKNLMRPATSPNQLSGQRG